jgi:two-component system OmpR family response regulator
MTQSNAFSSDPTEPSSPAGLRRKRVLYIEDNPVNAITVQELLQNHTRLDIVIAENGTHGVERALQMQPDLILIDMQLPDIDGLQVLQRMRSDGSDVPILFLTAKDSLDDRIAGLTVGGDDYVTKPFSLEEVVARLRSLIRRSTLTADANESPIIRVGDLQLDEDSYEVRRGDQAVELTATEFELLRYLMRNPRRVLSKSQILDRVWDYDFGGKSSVVEIYISYLRKKVDLDGFVPMIHTVRGAGYMLKAGE